MNRTRRTAFTLIELLVVIAVIAVLAALLFPVFAQARERARMSACVSNMRQIGAALMLYVQDYDETFPYPHFYAPGVMEGTSAASGKFTYVWKNAIAPYLRSIDVLGCPSNPFSRPIPGQPCRDFSQPKPGDNAEGWEVEPSRRMPISYATNSCALGWVPPDLLPQYPPARLADMVRPTETILIAEDTWGASVTDPGVTYLACTKLFAHSAGKLGNFVFFDGHVQSKKWLATLFPISQNNWVPNSPNPDPRSRALNAPWCGSPLIPSPDAKVFRTKECLAYQ